MLLNQPVRIILHRICEDRFGTHGRLTTEEGNTICFTIERPWLDNKHDVSCIPVGEYACIPHDSPQHPDCWEITGVPDRSAILIHTGNSMADTEGCVIVGGTATASGVLFSKTAMNKLHSMLPSHFVLDVYSEVLGQESPVVV